jgi:hypothetical protein
MQPIPLPPVFGDLQVDLSKHLGIQDFPEADQQEIIMEVGQNIMKRVIVELLNLLSEEKKNTFVDVANTGSQTAVMEFLKESIPGVDELVSKIVKEEIEISKNLIAV